MKVRLKYLCKLNPLSDKTLYGQSCTFLPMEKILFGTTNNELETIFDKEKSGYTFMKEGYVIRATVTPCFENGKGAVLNSLKNGFAVGSTELMCVKPTKINANLLNYIFLSTDFVNHCQKDFKGVGGLKRINQKNALNYEVPVNVLEKQDDIVLFLDKKCSKIDNEVYLLKQKSILLDEYKNALIYETVTKGLDKNAEMKDSGVEWIGEIPSHWKPIRLKDIVKSKITSGSTPNEHLILLEDDLKSNFVNFYKIENVNKNGKISKKYIISDDTNSGMTRSKLKENDILFTIAGTIGTVAIITSNDLPANVNQAIAIIRVKDKINHDFVKYFLTLLKGNNSARGGVIKNINLTTLSNLTISLPLTTEQNEIADYLNLETLKIEKQIELINKKVELLKEYKQSLIYEAVTGKLEIE